MGWDDKIIPWDYSVCPIPFHGIPKKNFPSHSMGFLILQQNSIEDRTYFYTVT
jgi:hypothetical protein